MLFRSHAAQTAAKEKMPMRSATISLAILATCLGGCNGGAPDAPTKATESSADGARAPDGRRYLAQPLVDEIYTADPSAHVFDGKLYIYPSHDRSEEHTSELQSQMRN